MKIKGIITAMVTPLDEKGEINEAGTRQLVEHLITDGVNGLFVLGTNGEFFSLSEAEKIKLVRIVVDQTNERVPVFVGAGGISTQAVIDLSNKFAVLGVDAVSIITPYLLKFMDNELIAHYETIAENTTLPIILYNIPGNTRNNISEAVFAELVKNPSFVGIKDSSGDVENFKKYLEYKQEREDFSFLMGSDSRIVESLQLGADGAVASTSNVLTKTDTGMYQLFLAGKLDEANKLQKSIDDFRLLCKIGTIPSSLKACLRQIGYNVGKPKAPILDIEPRIHDKMIETLRQYQKIEGFDLKE